MGFKRAEWHSGLTYRQTCRECKAVVEYKDDSLDFRPWYADGFVYCPKCRTPLRHNEQYAIDAAPETPTVLTAVPERPVVQSAAPQPGPEQSGTAAFCVKCGKQFNQDDRFCAGCGAKR